MDRLAIFARRPEPGKVKTRLSRALSVALASRLHVAMVEDAIDAAMATGMAPTVFWSEGSDGVDVPSRIGLAARQQQGPDLGARLVAAFSELLAAPGDRAVVIGSDCPDLEAGVIREAFAALDEHDLVLGPARDGGYYLIGLRRTAPGLFAGVSWGTGKVMAETLERATRSGITATRLGVLDDIDTPDDLVRFIARRAVAPPGPGARTEAALAELGLLPARA